MRRAALQLEGTRHGRLEVLSKATRPTYWRCLCDCGQEAVVRGSRLQNGITQSCGCLRKTHGHTTGGDRSGTYKTWAGMVARCKDATGNYADIDCDPKWLKFEAFLKDMGQRPEGKTLDRKNPFDGYNKANCQWATSFVQATNKRKAEILIYHVDGRMFPESPASWARYLLKITGNKAWTTKQLKACLKAQTLEQIVASVHPQGLTADELMFRQRRANMTAEQREQAAQVAKMDDMIRGILPVFN